MAAVRRLYAFCDGQGAIGSSLVLGRGGLQNLLGRVLLALFVAIKGVVVVVGPGCEGLLALRKFDVRHARTTRHNMAACEEQ
eukprot:gene13236-13366_t